MSLSFADLGIDPLSGSLNAFDNIASFLLEQPGPVSFGTEDSSVANNDQAVFGSSDANIDAILLLYEHSSSRAHHRYKHEVEFATLRAIDRDDLVIDLALSEVLGDGVLLGVVGRDDVD